MIVDRLKERDALFASMTTSAAADAQMQAILRGHRRSRRAARVRVLGLAAIIASTFALGVALARVEMSLRREPMPPPAPVSVPVPVRKDVRLPELEPEAPVAKIAPVQPKPKAKAEPKAKAKAKAKAEPEPDVAMIVETIARLRSDQSYDQLASFIAAQLETVRDRRARELLTFELATLYARPNGERARACAVWTTYLEEFARGLYEREAKQSLAELDCR